VARLKEVHISEVLGVHFPTTDGRTLILTRCTELNANQKLLVRQLNLDLPPQPPPRITARGQLARPRNPDVVETFVAATLILFNYFLGLGKLG
jgi:hypothetical protein